MDDAIAAVRVFNRFFTKFVGALDESFLQTGLSLAEARILFEIAQREPCFADNLQFALNLDAGFVSRVLRRFEDRGWIGRSRLDLDARRRSIRLTSQGRERFGAIDMKQRQAVEANLARLDESGRLRLVAALDTAQRLLEEKHRPAFTLRPFRAGDLGLIASRQSILYRDGFGWNSNIEVNVGEVTTAFLRDFKPGREQCWVAEDGDRLVGSILLTDEGAGLARLRLLYVEPDFHGRGVGAALVSACIAFARTAGYARITLWTHSILESARRLYTRHGFCIAGTSQHASFGPTLVGETWELSLDGGQ